MNSSTAKTGTILSLILVLATLVRLTGILSRPIWYDEAFAMLFSATGPSAMLYGTLTPSGAGAADIHPLGYYTLLWLWMKAFGSSLAAARGLSIMAGLATIGLIYLLAYELYNENIARGAALFVALSPFHIHYSQEIRMYAFLALWLVLSTYAFLRGKRSGKVIWWVIFAASSAMAQYTHNLAAFYLLPLAASPLIWRDGRSLRSVTLAGISALLLYLPWLIQLPSQMAKISNAYWVERPGFEKLFTLLLVYVTNLPLPNTTLLFISLFIALIAVAIGIMQTFRRGHRNNDAEWLLYLAFMPAFLLFLFSQWLPVYIERALLPSGVIFCIWLAWVLLATRMPVFIRNGLLISLAAGSTFGLYQHSTYRGFPYGPYREISAALRQQVEAGDVIVHASKATRLPMAYFDPALQQEYIADPPGSTIDTLASSTQEVLNLVASPDIPAAVNDAQRVWFIVLQYHIDAYLKLGYEDHPYLLQLKDEYKLQSTESWDDVRVFIFVKKSK